MTSDRPADEGQMPGRDALFRAVLTPNSSLGREGFRILIVEFTAKDIAAIPTGTDGKFRLHRCKVVAEKQVGPF